MLAAIVRAQHDRDRAQLREMLIFCCDECARFAAGELARLEHHQPAA